jgi:hypothetical protein
MFRRIFSTHLQGSSQYGLNILFPNVKYSPAGYYKLKTKIIFIDRKIASYISFRNAKVQLSTDPQYSAMNFWATESVFWTFESSHFGSGGRHLAHASGRGTAQLQRAEMSVEGCGTASASSAMHTACVHQSTVCQLVGTRCGLHTSSSARRLTPARSSSGSKVRGWSANARDKNKIKTYFFIYLENCND